MKRAFFLTLGFFFGGLVTASHANACDICAVFSANNAAGWGGRGLHVGVAEQYTYFGTLKNNGAEVPNTVGQYMDSSVTQAFLRYDFNKWLGVQLTLPVIDRYFRRPNGATVQTGNVFGIGDMSLVGRLMPYNKFTTHFSLNTHIIGGVKFPTGSTKRLAEELSEEDPAPGDVPSGIHGHDLTLGSGSFDGVIGGDAYLRWYRFLATSFIQYAIRSTGSYGYRFANDLQWSVGLGGFFLLRENLTFAGQAVFSGDHKGLDTMSGVSMDDTGITSLYCGPAFLLTWKNKLGANLATDIPIVMDNTALQVVPTYRIRASFTWYF